MQFNFGSWRDSVYHMYLYKLIINGVDNKMCPSLHKAHVK